VGEVAIVKAFLWLFGQAEWHLGNVRLRCEDWCVSAMKRKEARRG
jgi:hypothetical protein